MIKELKAALESALSLEGYPFGTDELKECFLYEWTPLSNDGAKQKGQLMLRIRVKDMATAEEKANAANEALVSFGDQHKNKAFCKQNGGGTLKNWNTGFIDWIMYYDLSYKAGL